MKKLLVAASLLLSQLALSDSAFYDLKVKSISGKTIEMSKYKGKTVIIVNTASNCGYTDQFSDLQSLYKTYKSKNVAVIGFPSSSFKQEFKSNDKVAKFCKLNYGVKFPMTSIVEVTGSKQHPIFKYLSKNDPEKGGDVSWNFEKFIVSKTGKVVKRFKSSTNPKSKEFLKVLKQQL